MMDTGCADNGEQSRGPGLINIKGAPIQLHATMESKVILGGRGPR